VFDRAYFRENKKYIFFTGRVRRNYKKFQSRKLIKISYLLQNTRKNIVMIKKNKYCHNIIKEDVLRDLKLRLKQTNMSIIETRQFVRSYKLLEKIK
jgi:hypothetical protein